MDANICKSCRNKKAFPDGKPCFSCYDGEKVSAKHYEPRKKKIEKQMVSEWEEMWNKCYGKK